MGFIYNNDGFVCEWCGNTVLPAPKTCRNHCPKCLASKHVDKSLPGDRAAKCGGKMELVHITLTSDVQYILTHQCKKCGKTIKNKAAEDDDQEEIFKQWKNIHSTSK